MWENWKAGDRKAALAEIPDEVVDDLIVHGSPAECRAKIQAYFDNGVTTSSLAILPLDPDLDHWQAVEDLSPVRGLRPGDDHAARRPATRQRLPRSASRWACDSAS